MRASWVAVAIGALLAVVAIPAAGQIVYEEITVSMTSEEFNAEFRGDRYTVMESQWLRNVIDTEHGNGDGEVTQAEVDAYVDSWLADTNAQLRGFAGSILFAGIQVKLEEDRPGASVTRSVTDLRFNQDILGPVQGDGEVESEIDARLTFADTPRPRVTVVFADDFRNPFKAHVDLNIEWHQAVFRGQGPWAIDPATIEPEHVRDAYYENGRFIVPYAEMGEFSSQSTPLSFDLVNTDHEELTEDKTERSPALPLAFLLVALGVLALTHRREG